MPRGLAFPASPFFPSSMKPVAQCRMDVNRKEEGEQGRCVAMLIAPIPTMTHLGFPFSFSALQNLHSLSSSSAAAHA